MLSAISVRMSGQTPRCAAAKACSWTPESPITAAARHDRLLLLVQLQPQLHPVDRGDAQGSQVDTFHLVVDLGGVERSADPVHPLLTIVIAHLDREAFVIGRVGLVERIDLVDRLFGEAGDSHGGVVLCSRLLVVNDRRALRMPLRSRAARSRRSLRAQFPPRAL